MLKIGDTVDMNALMKEHADYQAMSWRWRKMRILIAGEDAVKTWDISHTKGEPSLQTFILRPPGQDFDHYRYSVYSSRFLNLTARTADVLSGFLFYRSPVINVPEDMEDLLQNIDMMGTPLEEFAKTVAKEALSIGRGGILADYPDVPEGVQYTRGEAQAAGMRPFLKYYYAEQIFNWEYSVINNVRVLTKVFIDESFNDPLKDSEKNIIRVLELEPDPENGGWRYRNSLFIQGESEEHNRGDIRARATGTRRASKNGKLARSAIPLTDAGRPFSELPFQFVAPQYDQQNIEKAPLSDVADLNIEHYRKSVEISSALFHCAHPTPIFCGFQFTKGQQVLLGSRQGISSQDPNAHASYLELNGQSITEIRKERDAVLVEAASLGARIGASASKSTNETAEAARIKSSGDTSVLYTLTSSLDQIFQKVLTIMTQWTQASPEAIKVAFNREYMPYKLEGNDINALVGAVKAKLLSYEDFLDIMKTGGMIKQSRSIQEYLAAVKETAKLLAEGEETEDTAAPAVTIEPESDIE